MHLLVSLFYGLWLSTKWLGWVVMIGVRDGVTRVFLFVCRGVALQCYIYYVGLAILLYWQYQA